MKKSTLKLLVTFDLKLAEDEISTAELELIEAHFAEFLRQVLGEQERKGREVTDGCRALRPGLDDEAGR